MALFSGSSKAYLDLSYDLRDKRDWKIAVIREPEYLPEISAFAVDGTNGLLAVGSKSGKVFVTGSSPAANVLRIPRGAGVKLIAFATLVFKLICIDDREILHVFDLSQLGRPKLISSEPYKDSITSLTVSPYHSHAFIGLENGGVATFDILCLNRSPYIIPNQWKPHEKNLLHAGMLSSAIDSSDLMDVIIHPRDLNILFLSYTGGVVLYDLTEHRSLRHYELIIPPGAPGSLGYDDPDIMKARRPLLTSISVHASGQLFVAGYLDGTIAFWAADDEDRPLMVRTLDEVDVNFPEGSELDLALSNPQRPSAEELEMRRREPIAKLSWSSFGSQTLSDPYNGDSVLTILGGGPPNTQIGMTAIRLFSLSLPSPTTPSRDIIHPEIRKSLAKTFSSMDKFVYHTIGSPVDFLLVPKESPHFGCSLDPKAILLLFEWPEGQRSLEAKAFPPPSFGILRKPTTPAPTSVSERGPDNPLDADLASTLQSLKLDADPEDYTQTLPSVLWVGKTAPCDGDLVRLEKQEYEVLQSTLQRPISEVISRNGVAWVNYGDHDQAQDLLFTKRQSNRLLVTHHRDLTIRFQDVTPQLLIGSISSPLSTPFPAPSPHLTIELSKLLIEPCVATARNPLALDEAEVQSAQLTSESNECLVVMRSGHVFVYGFDERQRHMSPFMECQDLTQLLHIPATANTFQPTVMVDNRWGSVTTSEMSDIGFLAIAYDSGSLVVVDMRRPKVILQDNVEAKTQKRISVALHLHNVEDEKRIVSMKWVVCGFDEDATPRVRLLVSHRSGTVRVFTLTQAASNEWTVDPDFEKLEGLEHPIPRGVFVLQAKTGTSRAASRATFKEALQGGADPMLTKGGDEKDDGAHCFFISAGEKGVKCQVNLAGGRAGKTEWGKGRKVECVQVVGRNGAYGLVAVMESREIVVYSLPALEPIQNFQLFKQPNSAICMDDTGDYVDWVFDERGETIVGATLGTVFAIRRVFDEPVIDFTAGRRAAPSMPPIIPSLTPVSYLGSWFNFKKSKSGDAIDDLLAGPNRPIPQDAETSTIVNSEWQAQMQTRAQAIANQASKTGSNLYANLSAAVSERGEMLNGLQEQFSSLEEGSRKMVFEAKKLAAQQSGKRWFNF